MKRTACSACGCHVLNQFLDLGQSPIADAYPATASWAQATYPLQVAVCAKCQLVQLLEVVDHHILFGTGYSFYSSASAPLSAYHQAYAADVHAKHADLITRGVVEIGCNDGDMLRHFTAAPALGVDPAEGPVAAARARGLDVLQQPFGVDVACGIRAERGRQGVVIANHVLAHVDDVADVLAGVQELLADDGVVMVEVQYLPDLLVNNAFDLVYHEHRNFFSLSSLEQAAQNQGLYVIDAELTDRQGGSLRATLAKTSQCSFAADTIRASERWLWDWGAYEGMQGRAERIRQRLCDLVANQNGVVGGYGVPAKATTLLNFCQLGSDAISFATDTTVAKQGRYIPGTGIPIVAPDVALHADTLVLFAWNYLPQIVRQEAGYRGRWIVPIPAPVLI